MWSRFVLSSGFTMAVDPESAFLLQAAVHKLGALNNAIDPAATLLQVRNLREKMDSGFEFSQPEVVNILDLVTMLENEFLPAIDLNNANDQVLFDQALARLQVCVGHKNTKLTGGGGDVDLYLDEVNSTRHKHDGCLLVETTLSSYQTLANTVYSATWSAMTGTSLNDSDLCGYEEDFTDALGTYRKLPPVGVASGCEQNQESLEAAYCDWLRASVTTCAAFEECVAAVGLDAIILTIENDIETRRAIHYNVQVIKCHLTRLNKADPNRSDIQCDNVPSPLPELYALNLTKPDLTLDGNCTDVAGIPLPLTTFPSTSNVGACALWRTQEYASDGILECEYNCVIPGGTTTGHAYNNTGGNYTGCADWVEIQQICPFYNIHQTVCGTFNDNATDGCCACNGGTPL